MDPEWVEAMSPSPLIKAYNKKTSNCQRAENNLSAKGRIMHRAYWDVQNPRGNSSVNRTAKDKILEKFKNIKKKHIKFKRDLKQADMNQIMESNNKSRQNLTPLIRSTETDRFNKSATNQGRIRRTNRMIKSSSSSSNFNYFK